MLRLYSSLQPPQPPKMPDSLRTAMTAQKPIVVTVVIATVRETRTVDAGAVAGTDVGMRMEMKT
jgi:hypothetical protein